MGRFYTNISKEDFLAKVKDLIMPLDEDGEESDDGFPWEMPSQLDKDLGKVNFDWENYTRFNDTSPYANYPWVGYKELIPGFHTFFMQAGGDWEFPVCFMLYWGEGQLRAYIPKDGNAWNKKEKCAYGDTHFEIEKQVNEDKLRWDILHRITKKL